jgi:hypothetical protein
MSTAVGRDTRASEPLPALEPASPQNGDVVVAREVGPRVHYTVRQIPGIVQFSSGTRDAALELARKFARRYKVDVWHSERGKYRRLEAYRPRTSTGARVDQSDNVLSKD